jgi:sugar lactone lactonase YvrE
MGLAARFSYPNGLAVDGNGNLLVADTGGNRIRKIVVATGSVTTLAGFSGACGSRDGSGDLAEFCSPTSLVCDGAGNLFVTESGNHTVRKVVVATGAVATFAGRGSSTGSDDGIGGHARFSYPTGLVSDNGGNLLVADSVNHTIRKVVVATGAVSTVAGLAGYGGSVDGTGNGARFNFPVDLAYDGAGSVFVADQDNMLIRKVVVATAAVTTMAGSAGQAGSDDGIGMAARFAQPSALAFDGAGSLFVADGAMHTIRQIALATAAVTTLAGSAGVAGSDDGVGTNARFHTPSGLACDGAGQLFVADRGNYTIRKIVIATGTVTTLAGAAGEAGTDDGPGTAARFLAPEALTKDRAGNLFVADVEGNTVRHVDVITGVVTTVVGHARRWQIVPGPLPAYIASPGGLAVLPSGDLAITDRLENVVLLARF